jgi:hypothetical protein
MKTILPLLTAAMAVASIVPQNVSAHSHMGPSAPAGQGQPRGNRYVDPFGYSGYYPGAALYDFGSYSYPFSPEQQMVAQKEVMNYFAAVSKDRRGMAKHRYIAVETLRPTKPQREDYLKRRTAAEAKGAHPAARSVNPAQLRCLMVFDTQKKQFVGSGCYVVERLPANGTVEKFDTVSAEFVGQGTL